MAAKLRLIIISDTEGTLATDTVGPEAAQIDIRFWQVGVGDKKPGAKDGLGQDVEYGISDNGSIH